MPRERRTHEASQETVGLLGVARRRRPALLVGTALQAGTLLLLATPGWAQPAPSARPTGGVLTAGSATISNGASATTITQSSQRAAINWQSFNVGSAQTVDFVQPSSSASALNRVISPNPSQIAGHIDANGQIILINQSGVIFDQGAQVNTAGLIVSAAGMNNVNFMAGKLVFDQAAHPNAAVVNQGSLTVRQAGLAALVAPQVANSGVITAKLGHVVLAGAKTATLDMYGDGLVSLDVTNAVTQVPKGPGGAPVTALVTNTGVVRADGGTVQLTARAADGLVQDLVQAGGKISADSVGSKTGSVVLGGLGGSIVLSGVVTANGSAPGSTGGHVQADADQGVTLAAGARVSASGPAGGGVVAIGTTLKRAKGGPGTASRLTAQTVQVDQGVRIAADATGNGDGGRVTVLSSQSTSIAGAITAQGGPLGGNGGFVETSGQSLSVASSAVVDAGARAPTGTPGTWLLDPADITISDNATSGLTLTGGNYFPNASTSTDNLFVGDLQTALGTTNVTVQTICISCTGPLLGSITVSNPVTWAANTTLTLSADNNIAVNAAISGSGAGSGLTLFSGVPPATAAGSITIRAPISVNSFTAIAQNGGTINLDDGAGVAVATGGGGQRYDTPVVLQSGTSLTGTGAGQILFANTVNGEFGLTVNAGTGMVTFGGAVGGTTPLASLTVVTGPTTLAGNVTTSGSQTYNSAVTLNATDTLTTTNSAIDFVSTVDATTAGNQGLTVSTGTGAVTFGGAVGGSQALASLAVTGPTTLGGNVTTSGSQTYNSAVTLNATDTLTTTNSAIDFVSTVDATTAGNQGLTTSTGTGVVTFGGAVGGTTPLASLTVTGPTTLAGNVTTSGGGQTYFRPVMLQAATGLTETGGGQIQFFSTVDGGFGLAVNAGSGAVTFFGPVGATTPLASLTVTGPTTLGDNVTTTGAQTYNSAVTLGVADNMLTTTANGAITLNGPVTGGGISLMLSSGTGAQTLSGITTSGNLTLSTTGTVTLDGGIYTITGGASPYVFPAVTTNGTLTLGQATNFGAVTLGSPATIDSTNTAIGFTSTVDGASGLTVSAGTGTVTFGGAVGGTTPLASLQAIAGTITLGGNVTVTGALELDSTGPGSILAVNTTLSAATLDLISAGSIMQNGGSIQAVTLTGSAVSSGSLTQSTNLVGTLAAFTTNGGFALTDNEALTVTGPVTDSAAGQTVALTTHSGAITLDGVISAANDTLNLTAAGSIMQSGGSINVSMLTGTAGGFQLTSTGNAIGTIDNLIATGGNITVVNGQNLSLSGTQSGNNLFYEVAVAGDNLSLGTFEGSQVNPAILTAAAGGRISLVQDSLSQFLGSTVTATGGTVELAPFSAINTSLLGSTGLVIGPSILGNINTGATGKLVVGGYTNVPANATAPAASAASVTIDGAVDLTGVASTLLLQSRGPITENAGPLTVGTLEATGGAITLSNPNNAITVLGDVTSTSFTLNDIVALVLNGDVTATSSASITDTVSLTQTGDLRSPAITLSAGSGGIALNGTSVLGQNGAIVDLTTTGGVSEAGTASIVAVMLQSSGGVDGPVTLGNTNTVPVVGNFTVSGTGNGFQLVDSGDLTVSGPLTAPGNITLNTSGAGSVTVSGNIGAGAGATLSITAGSGGVALNGSATAGTLDLLTTGQVSQSVGLAVGTLTGNAGSVVLDNNSNNIATLGSFTTTNAGFNLNDTGNTGTLNVTGPVTAATTATITIGATGAIDVTGSIGAGSLLAVISGSGGITVNGNAKLIGPTIDLAASAGMIALNGNSVVGQTGASVDLTTTANITQAASSTLVAATLQTAGSAIVDLAGTANAVGALNGVTASTSFTLNDGTNLTVNDEVLAPRIALLAPGQTVTLSAGTTISTGGTPPPSPPGPPVPADEPSNGAPGAYIEAASVTQVGSSTLTGQGNAEPTLQISVTNTAQFDPPLGLEAPTGWLILNLGTGTAAGNVFVNTLNVTYDKPGSTNLTGTIAGIAGGAAATAGFIEPAINVNYLFNGCVIGAAVCLPVTILPPGETPPFGPPYLIQTSAVPVLVGLLRRFLLVDPPLRAPACALTDPNAVPPNVPYPACALTDHDVVPPNVSYVDY